VHRLPDGELQPTVGAVRDDDVYVVQPTGPPVNEHLVELLLILDACRRAGAGRLTAVVPYLAYTRQDRRGASGQAVAARVVADLIASAGADRLLVIDPHTTALEAMSAIPVEILTAVPVLADALAGAFEGEPVVVAPDLGAVRLAERYASRLRCPVAVVHKVQLTDETVQALELVGDVEGRVPIVVDDMISTGGTVEAAVRLLVDRGAASDVVVAATHGLLIGRAFGRLRSLPLRRLLVTDSVAPAHGVPLPLDVCSIVPLLAEAVGRLHRGEPLDDLLVLA
jgi:ribose-phosphate pyrophosphokinase